MRLFSVNFGFDLEDGAEVFRDGYGNEINDALCKGVFNLALGSCEFFLASPAPTHEPTRAPTNQPTKRPTASPTAQHTPSPTNKLTAPMTSPPTLRPTVRPTVRSTPNPIPAATPQSTSDITSQPSLRPTIKPTRSTTSNSTDERVEITPTPAPTKKVTSQPTLPTPNPNDEKGVLAPSRPPSPKVYIGVQDTESDGIPSMCTFNPFEGECIQVKTFVDFKTAIETGEEDIVFCGGFQLRKTESAPIRISKDVDIRCVEACTIFGVGPYIQIGGAMSKVRISNMRFINSKLESAVLISTMTSLSETTFCDTEFESNQIRMGSYGGAINIDQRSGVVNIVRSTFTDNSAHRGGAIYSHGWLLNIIDSRFIANKAFNTGNAVFIAEESHVTVKSTTFLLNSVDTEEEGMNAKTQNYAIAVDASKSIRATDSPGNFLDAGKNRVIMSGDCDGFYNLWTNVCIPFVTVIT